MVTSGIPNRCDHVMSCPSETRGTGTDEEDESEALDASWVRRSAGVARGRQGLGRQGLGGRQAAGGAPGRRRWERRRGVEGKFEGAHTSGEGRE
jgi:hypothetical protein